jgi:hypothetical protein
VLSLDPTTRAEYDAAETPSARAAVVIAAITGTVTATVYDGSDVARGSGTMQTPWASIAGSRLVIGELASFLVTSGGTPDANWYLAFEAGGRWLRGPFGLTADAWADFKWSLATFATGQTGRLGTVEVQAQGFEPVESPYAASWNMLGYAEQSFSVTWGVEDGTAQPLTMVIPASLSVAKGNTVNFAQYASGGTPPYTLYEVETGTLPAGTFNSSTGAFTAAADATIGTSTGLSIAVTDSATVPLALTGLAVTSATYYAVGLAWDATPGASFYQVERSASGGAFALVNTTASTTYSDSSVSAATPYIYRVRAGNGTEFGEWATVSVTTAVRPVITGAEEDWVARSTGPGVVWAHDFRNVDEMRLFRNATSFAKAGTNVLSTDDSFADPQVEDPLDPRLGNSKALVHRIVAAQLSQPCSPTDTRIYVVSNADFPDPAVIGHPYGGRSATDNPGSQSVLLGAPGGSQYSDFSSSVTVAL